MKAASEVAKENRVSLSLIKFDKAVQLKDASMELQLHSGPLT